MEGDEEVVVVRVGRCFCAPYPIELTLQKQALAGYFTVTDSNGYIVLQVVGLHSRRVLNDAKGNALLTMRKRKLSMHKRWEAFKSSDDDKKIVFTAKKSSIFQLKTALDVFLASNTREKQCDFRVKGSFIDRQCTVYQGDRVVAEMKRKYMKPNVNLVGKEIFAVVVVVVAGIDCAFIVSLLIILHEISRNHER